MAMPANLTSFSLASTYGTVPSPSNLKMWRITTEPMYTLCSKDVCTTAHIIYKLASYHYSKEDIHSGITLSFIKSLNPFKLSF